MKRHILPNLQEEIPMRKIISVLLAILMIFSVMAVAASAENATRCDCGKHDETLGATCYCCVNCPFLPASDRFSCAEKVGDKYETCCERCDGFHGAIYGKCTCGDSPDCGCKYCLSSNKDADDDSSYLDKVVSDQDKENFVDGFQAVLKKISDVFDRFFNAIFEFLRLDEILGRN